MAISFVTAGTAAVGTTSLSIPHPGSIAAGNMLIIFIGYKTVTTNPVTPSGWQQGANDFGSKGTGIDGGDGVITFFWKIALGNETGNLTVTMTGGNSAVGRMFQYSKASVVDWQIPIYRSGKYLTGATSWNTGSMNLPIAKFNNEIINIPNQNRILAGDMILVGSGINSDGPTFASQLVTATNTTFGTVTERQDSGTTSGQDCRLVVSQHPVSTSTFNNNTVSYSMTASTSGTNFPVGASMLVILRELTKPALVLNSPADAATNRPINTTVAFTGTEPNSLSLHYEVQISKTNFSTTKITRDTTSNFTITGTGFPALCKLADDQVAFIDHVNDSLRTYTRSGTAWSLTGSGLTITGIGSPALARLSNTRVALTDEVLETITAYDFNGTTWSQVGSSLSIAGMGFPAICNIDANRIAFFDSVNKNLRTYEFNGSVWSLIGTDLNLNALTGAPGITSLANNRVSIIVDTGQRIIVCDFNGTTWSQVGSDYELPIIGNPAITSIGNTIFYVDETFDTLKALQFTAQNTWLELSDYDLPLGFAMTDPALTAISPTKIALIANTDEILRVYDVNIPEIYSRSLVNSGFSSAGPFTSGVQVSYTPQFNLEPSTTYFWRVRAAESGFNNAWSSWSQRSFTVGVSISGNINTSSSVKVEYTRAQWVQFMVDDYVLHNSTQTFTSTELNLMYNLFNKDFIWETYGFHNESSLKRINSRFALILQFNKDFNFLKVSIPFSTFGKIVLFDIEYDIGYDIGTISTYFERLYGTTEERLCLITSNAGILVLEMNPAFAGSFSNFSGITGGLPIFFKESFANNSSTYLSIQNGSYKIVPSNYDFYSYGNIAYIDITGIKFNNFYIDSFDSLTTSYGTYYFNNNEVQNLTIPSKLVTGDKYQTYLFNFINLSNAQVQYILDRIILGFTSGQNTIPGTNYVYISIGSMGTEVYNSITLDKHATASTYFSSGNVELFYTNINTESKCKGFLKDILFNKGSLITTFKINNTFEFLYSATIYIDTLTNDNLSNVSLEFLDEEDNIIQTAYDINNYNTFTITGDYILTVIPDKEIPIANLGFNKINIYSENVTYLNKIALSYVNLQLDNECNIAVNQFGLTKNLNIGLFSDINNFEIYNTDLFNVFNKSVLNIFNVRYTKGIIEYLNLNLNEVPNLSHLYIYGDIKLYVRNELNLNNTLDTIDLQILKLLGSLIVGSSSNFPNSLRNFNLIENSSRTDVSKGIIPISLDLNSSQNYINKLNNSTVLPPFASSRRLNVNIPFNYFIDNTVVNTIMGRLFGIFPTVSLADHRISNIVANNLSFSSTYFTNNSFTSTKLLYRLEFSSFTDNWIDFNLSQSVDVNKLAVQIERYRYIVDDFNPFMQISLYNNTTLIQSGNITTGFIDYNDSIIVKSDITYVDITGTSRLANKIRINFSNYTGVGNVVYISLPNLLYTNNATIDLNAGSYVNVPQVSLFYGSNISGNILASTVTRGRLIIPATQEQLLDYSEDFLNAYWNPISVTYNGLDGWGSFIKPSYAIDEFTVNANTSSIPAAVYNFSVHVKNIIGGGPNILYIDIYSISTNINTSFQLNDNYSVETSKFASAGGNIVVSSVDTNVKLEDETTGWYRVDVSFYLTATDTLNISLSSDTTVTIMAAQLNKGSVPANYIKTPSGDAIIGNLNTNSTNAGILEATVSKVGTLATSSTVSGQLKGTTTLDVDINTNSSLNGVIKGRTLVTATSSTNSSLNGLIKGRLKLLANTSSTNSAILGLLIANGNGQGTINTSSNLSATLIGIKSAIGNLNISSILNGILKSRINAIGTINTNTSLNGNIDGYIDIVGVINTSSTLTGDIFTEVFLTGNISTSSLLNASLKSLLQATGNLNISTSLNALIKALGLIDSNINSNTSISANIDSFGDLSGDTHIITFLLGDLVGKGDLESNISTNSITSGLIKANILALGTLQTNSNLSALLKGGSSLSVNLNTFSTLSALLDGTLNLDSNIDTNSLLNALIKANGRLQANSISTNTILAAPIKANGIAEGDLNSSSTLSAFIGYIIRIIGSSNQNTTLSGIIKSNLLFSGNVNTNSLLNANINYKINIFGSLSTNSNLNGELSASGKQEGSINTSTNLFSEIEAKGKLESNINSSSSLSALLIGKTSIEGQVSSNSLLNAVLKGSSSLEANTSTNSNLQGIIKSNVFLVGNLNTSLFLSGSAFGLNSNGGSSFSNTALTANIDGKGELSSSINNITTLSADLTININIYGEISGNEVLQGLIKAKGDLDGNSISTNSALLGTVNLFGEAAGNINSSSNLSGLLVSSIGLFANINTFSTSFGNLKAIAYLSENIETQTILTGEFDINQPIEGQILSSTNLNANLKGYHKAQSDIIGSSFVASTLRGVANHAGDILGETIITAEIKGIIYILGSITTITQTEASINATINVIGTLYGNSDLQGLLTRIQLIFGDLNTNTTLIGVLKSLLNGDGNINTETFITGILTQFDTTKIKVYQNGQWIEGTLKIRRNGQWETVDLKQFINTEWIKLL